MAKRRKQQSRRKQAPALPRFNITVDRVFVYAIAAVVFIIPLFIWPGETEYGYGKTIIMFLVVSALLIAWAIRSAIKGEWRIRLPWLVYPAGFLLLVGLLSMINAVNGRVVIQSLAVFLYFLLFYLIVANAVKEKRDVTVILYALLISSFLASLYGLLQYLGVMRGATGGHGLGEIISTMGNRNYLGGFLAYLLFPTVILVVRLRSRILRAIAIPLISFNFGMAMLVNQTGIRVALIVAAIGVIIGWAIFRPVEPIRRNRAWLIALLIVLAFTFLVEAPSGPLNSVVGLSATKGSSWIGRLWAANAGKTRAWDWWVGYEMFKDHPLLGVGLGNYKLNFIPYKAKFLATPQGKNYNFYIPRAAQAHNEYVQLLAELGILGIIGLVGLIGMIAYSLWTILSRNSDEADRFDLLLLTGGVITFLIHGLVSFPAHLPASSLALVTILGIATSRAYGDAVQTTVVLRRNPLCATAVVAVAFALMVSVIAVGDYSADFLFQAGLRQLQLGQTNLAIETLNRSIALDFCPRQAYYYRAMGELQQGKYKDALADLKRCRTRFVTEQVYLNIANIAVNLGDTKTAKENVALLLATHPDKDTVRQAHYLEGIIAIREKDYQKARDILNALLKESPDFERAYIARGDLYRVQGYTETARKDYEKALALIEKKLSQTQKKLSSTTRFTAEEYSRLRSEINLLQQEKKAVEASLSRLP